jgi:hypothetical protein
MSLHSDAATEALRCSSVTKSSKREQQDDATDSPSIGTDTASDEYAALEPLGLPPQASAPFLHQLDLPNRRALASSATRDQPDNDNVGAAATLKVEDLNAEEDPLSAGLNAPTEVASVPDSDADALIAASDPAVPKAAAEPSLSTRPATHVAPSSWFDVTLDIPGADGSVVDLRQRLSWRFKAVFAAYKQLVLSCASSEQRQGLATLLRSYERQLRAGGPTPSGDPKQLTDLLHAQLEPSQAQQLERALAEVEAKMLAIDASISDESFRARWNKQQQPPKALLRYARFLACRRFDLGYRRDRFEAIAQELLTVRMPSGGLMLVPRKRAAPVLRQLVRGLAVAPGGSKERIAACDYVREALDRLESLTSSQQFFDSGFFQDVYGYKITMHERITDPEFLYLSVAINVEVHNRLRAFAAESAAGKSAGVTSIAQLTAALRAQEATVQAVFGDFRQPAGAGVPDAPSTPAKRTRAPKPRAKTMRSSGGSLWKVAVVSLLLVGVVGANLLTSGVVALHRRSRPVPALQLHELSPLLLRGTLNAAGTNFSGLVARPAWRQLAPRARLTAAEDLAKRLLDRGVKHAEILAYKTRAIQIDFGTVTYVDDAK